MGIKKGWSQSPALNGGGWPWFTSWCSIGVFFRCQETPLFELAVDPGAGTQRKAPLLF